MYDLLHIKLFKERVAEISLALHKRAQEQSLKGRTLTLKVKNYKFDVGDIVRISHLRNVFSREYDERWTREEFVVTSRFIKDNHRMYTLKDYDNEPILGTFYQNELQRVRVEDGTV